MSERSMVTTRLRFAAFADQLVVGNERRKCDSRCTKSWQGVLELSELGGQQGMSPPSLILSPVETHIVHLRYG